MTLSEKLMFVVRPNKPDELRELRSVAARNLAKFNGIFDTFIVAALGDREPTPAEMDESLGKVSKLYAEARDSYRSHKGYFSDQDIRVLDAAMDGVEKTGAAPTASVHKVRDFLELLVKKTKK